MSEDIKNVEWPAEAGSRDEIKREMKPPDRLQNRIVDELIDRGLIRPDAPMGHKQGSNRIGWLTMRASIAAAACVAFVMIGVVIGRTSTTASPETVAVLKGDESNLYALLLYETDDYDRPEGREAVSRFGEYSKWVALARDRDQFVTGEDLEVESSWIVAPSSNGPLVTQAATIEGKMPLSGIFFIRGRNAQHALQLAKELPHVKHGGSVVVQKTIPTDVPPPLADS